MHRCTLAALALLFGTTLLPGCSSNSSNSSSGSDSDSGLVGRWTLQMFDVEEQTGYVTADLCLVEIRRQGGKGGKDGKDGKLSASVLDGTRRLRGAKVVRFEVDDRTVRLELEGSSGMADFEGRRDGDGIRGNVATGGFQLQPAWMVRTEKSRLSSRNETQPAEGVEAYGLAASQAQQDGDSFAATRSFTESHPDLPLTIHLFRQLSLELTEQKPSRKATERFAAAYFKASERWGARMVAYSKFDMGWELLKAGQHLEQAESYLREARQGLPESIAELFPWNKVFAQAEAKSLFAEATGEDAARAKAAAEKLVRLHEQHPFDHLVLYTAAEAARRRGDKENALQLFGRLAVWPMMERLVISEPLWMAGDRVLPQSHLLQLWVEARGTETGLERFKDELFEQCMTAFAAPLEKPGPSRTPERITLVELFTGSQCPPCVAADVATVGVERTFPRDRVVVLRYHQHIPGPDPLANGQGTRRFADYEGRGTPTIAVNGRTTEFNVGGRMLSDADSVYAHLRDALSAADEKTTKIRIDLQAALQSDDRVQASARLSGIDPSAQGDLRLHLVLAEDDLRYTADNGIRRHDLVMRHMLGGVEGLPATNGEIVPPSQPSLAAIRSALSQHLADVEQAVNEKFTSKPMRLRPLWLVGFVQNARTKEVLQAAAIPVSGAGPIDRTEEPETTASTPPTLPTLPPAPGGEVPAPPPPAARPRPPQPVQPPSVQPQPAEAQPAKAQSRGPQPAVAEQREPTGPALRPPGE